MTPFTKAPVPWLTTGQMVEVDRLMVEAYRIELKQMMENAGRNLAALGRSRFLGGNPMGRRVAVLAGPGGNGGGALVATRRLANWGAHVEVALARPAAAFTEVAGHQLAIAKRLGLRIVEAPDADSMTAPELILDGIIGYSLRGAPRDGAAALIRWSNQQRSRGAAVLALDTPSGLDTSNGTQHDPAVVADATMTLALPKEGLRAPMAAAVVGELYLADIGVPPGLYAEPSLQLHVGPGIFAESDIVRLSGPQSFP